MNCTSPSSPDRPNCNVVAVDASEGNVTSIVSLNVNATNLLDNENPIVLYMASEYQSAETTLDAENWPVKPSGIVLNMAWLRVSTLNRFTEDGYFTPYIAPNSTIEAMRCTLYTAVQEIHARVEKGTTYMENTTDEIISAKYEEREANKLSYIYEYAPSGRPPKNFSITSFQQQVLFDGIKLSMPQENGGFGGGVVTIGHNGVLAGMEQSAPPLIPALLYQAKDIFQSVRSLAHYMTVSMRANDTILAIENGESPRSFDAGFGPGFVAPSHRVEGKVFASVIHVEVRWWWLAMPAVLTILAFVLLVTTIVESYRGRVAIWKDSPLALLLNTHWEPGLERRGEGTVTAADIANEVKGLKATFVTGREGSEEKGMKYDRRILVSAS